MLRYLSFFSIVLLVFSGTSYAQAIEENPHLVFHWEDTSLPGSFAFNNTYNEVWGFVQNDREYAVIGSTAGTHIFDLTDTINIYQVAFIEGEVTGGDIIHRDYHDYKGYLYIVADEGPSTLQIVDLTNLPFSADVVYNSDELFTRSHNIFIDTTNAILYACFTAHTNNTSSGMEVFSVQNPTNPQWISEFNTAGVHDVYVRDNIAYLNIGQEGFVIADYSNPADPIILGSLSEYSSFGQGYNHSGWLTEDGNYYVFADENHGLPLKVCAVSNYDDLQILSTFSSDISSNSIVHNVIIKDKYAFVSHYHDGLQVFDISNPLSPTKVSSYKTYEPNDHTSYRGAWGVYPNLPSGLILVSDMQYGLFVLNAGLGVNTATAIASSTAPTLPFEATVYPTVSKGMVQLDIAVTTPQTVEIALFNVHGQQVYSQQLLVQQGQQTVPLNLQSLPKGQLLLKVGNKTHSWNNKIVHL